MNSKKSINQFEIEKRILEIYFLINVFGIFNKIDFFQIFLYRKVLKF